MYGKLVWYIFTGNPVVLFKWTIFTISIISYIYYIHNISYYTPMHSENTKVCILFIYIYIYA